MSTTTLKAASDLAELRAIVASTHALLSTFQKSLISTTSSSSSDIADPPNPLRLLSDACALLKAQTTKLSLLILNKPFTPSAVTFILKNLSTECLPTLITALELCSPKQYTVFLKDHIRASLSRILREITSLLGTIPLEDTAIVASFNAEKEGEGRNTLASTGVIWEVCDSLIALAAEGLVQIAMKKADAYHALIKDAIKELEDWNPEEDDDDIFGSGSSSHSENNEDVRDQITTDSPPTAAMNSMTLTPPATPTPIRQMYEQTLSTLRLIRLLYPALRKRRIQTFPRINSATSPDQLPTSWQIYAFDNLMKSLRLFSETSDELAGALYSQDEDQASGGLELIKLQALECVQELDQSWDRKQDEFTAWSKQWISRLEELGPMSGCAIS